MTFIFTETFDSEDQNISESFWECADLLFDLLIYTLDLYFNSFAEKIL